MVHWLAWLIFSFRGRIPRKHFWLGQLLIYAVAFAGGYLIEGPKLWAPGYVSPWLIAWNFLLWFPSLAITVKRFNDRGRPVWFAAIWLVFNLAGAVAAWLGLWTDPKHFTRGAWALLAVLSVAGLWLLIDLGFLRGQRGSNRYGPDPLGPADAADAAPQPAQRTRGDNIRDAVTALALVIALMAFSGWSFGLAQLSSRAFVRLSTPPLLRTFEQQLANKPAMEQQKLGRNAYMAGDFQGALHHFSRAIALFGSESRTAADSYRNRARVQRALGHMPEALADYDKAITLEPYYVPGYDERAALLIALHRYDDAMKDFATALRQEPDSADTLVARGKFLAKMQRHQQADADFAEALTATHKKYDDMIARSKNMKDYWIRTRDDVIVKAHVGRGNVFRSEKRGGEALAEYAEALKLRPKNPIIYIERGWLYEKQGKLDLARLDYEKAAALRPPNAWLKRALERMR